MYLNQSKYQKYFDAYKDLTIGLAKILIRENGGNGPDGAKQQNFWEKMLKFETKIAEVSFILSLISYVIIKYYYFDIWNVTYFFDEFRCHLQMKNEETKRECTTV